MAEQELSEQLNQFVEAIVASSDAPLPRGDSDLAPLARIAVDLRGLPRDSFRARLRNDLERRAAMMTSETTSPAQSVKPVREELHTITPYLAVREALELIDFVKQAFGAEGTIHGTGSEGGIHAEYKIGDSIIMIGGGGAWKGTPKLTALHLHVDDVDAVYQRALDAGATSMIGPIENHGERVAGVKDIAGNEWYIAKRLSGSHTDEGLRTVTPYLHPQGAAKMIEFLRQAFGAEEVIVHRAEPEGPVLHAKIKIGDSILEMGEAHGPYQPMHSMFFLNVDDVDTWYRRALAGGATSMEEPKDQFYGDRVGAVTDQFGNTWYIATHIQEIG